MNFTVLLNKMEEEAVKNRFVILPLVMLILLAGGVLSCQSSSAVSDGQTAPDFTLKDISGNDFSLSNTEGKVVILDFWATWCPPCRMEVPHFEALYRRYKSEGLVIVGVSLDRAGAAPVREFAREADVSYPLVMGDQATVSAYGGIRGIPTTFIIDRQGRIVEKVVGYRDREFFESRIKDLL
ncbi:MAG: redoxin domain-containing protein [Candidatus Omnitrophica bacterium]|nr:redoxin domain-containing protein [Candidatus Omnitrophota bacterium]